MAPNPPTSYHVLLTKLSSTNQNLRSTTVEGIASALPEEGCSFRVIAKSLTPGGLFRLVETSKIVEVTKNEAGQIDFKTENSHYCLDILPNEEEE